MSALPPKADMCSAKRDVRFVPIADIGMEVCNARARLLIREPECHRGNDHDSWLSDYENMIGGTVIDGIGWAKSFGWGPPMTVQSDHDQRSDYDLRHLVLLGVAAIVLLVFAWTFVV